MIPRDLWCNLMGSGGESAIATGSIMESAGWSDVWRGRRDTPHRQAGVPYFAICHAMRRWVRVW